MNGWAAGEENRGDAPADVGAYAQRAAVQGEEGALAAGGAACGHVPVVGVGRAAEDVVVGLAPLAESVCQSCVRGCCGRGEPGPWWLSLGERRAVRTWSVWGTLVRTKGTAPRSWRISTSTLSISETRPIHPA